MNFTEFEEHLIRIYDGVAAMQKDLDPDVKSNIVEMARESYFACENGLSDEGKNFLRWLEHKSCVIKNPITGGFTEVNLPRDYEVLYEFLIFCKKQNEDALTEEEFLAFLESLEMETDD